MLHYFNNEKQKYLKKFKLKIISIDKNLEILKDTTKIFGEFFLIISNKKKLI
jgi:hypothetical protein